MAQTSFSGFASALLTLPLPFHQQFTWLFLGLIIDGFYTDVFMKHHSYELQNHGKISKS